MPTLPVCGSVCGQKAGWLLTWMDWARATCRTAMYYILVVKKGKAIDGLAYGMSRAAPPDVRVAQWRHHLGDQALVEPVWPLDDEVFVELNDGA